MVVRFRKKVRKMRGWNRGFGEKKKHRGKGSHGGKGYAGSTKHKKSYIVRFEPDHFDHKGFHSLGKEEARIVNVSDIEKMAGGKNEINLTELGYDKLLGNGEISAPLTVHVLQFSKAAKEKIEKAGGKLLSPLGKKDISKDLGNPKAFLKLEKKEALLSSEKKEAKKP